MTKVAIIQTDIKWADPIANQQAVESALLAFNAVEPPTSNGQQPKSIDLYVLPEMWNTGFMADKPTTKSQEPTLPALEGLQRLAQKLNAAIAGSMAVCEGDKLYNRLYFVTPEETFFYDKRHLFSYAGETREYVAGDRRVVVSWRGVRFLLQVCYDLRFPVFSRSRGDYDAIIYVACWPEKRIDAWQSLLKARAIENQCFVVGVNRVGADAVCQYSGCSVVHDAYGRIIASCAPNIEEVSTATFDMDGLQRFRRKFPVLADADGFSLG